ncbi:EAL domain-containing protein [Neptunomonas sp.]|uniref:EAL domain-containing protein n=1 Tax=Neptunomonas sp. TaxID=1971898 RepID=UPI0025D44995|nr:EAL domain-containing protein [Neptunomonas sp.]
MFSSLKSRLYILVLIVALPGVITIFFQATQERALAIEEHTAQAVETARRLAQTQQVIINDTEKYLKYLSSVKEIQNPSSASCQNFLGSILKLNTAYINIGVPKSDGELLCSALPLNKKVNVFDRAYFQHSLKNKEFAIGTYQYDRVAQRTSVNFSYPVIDSNGTVTAMTVVVVSLDWWSNQLSDYNLPLDSIAFISDEDTSIVANFPIQISLHGLKPRQYNVNIEASREYQLKTEVIQGTDGLLRIFTHKTLYKKANGKTVTVSVGIPVDKALEQANYQFITNLVYFLAFLGFVTILAIKGLRSSILQPLQQITGATEKLEQGELTGSLQTHGAMELTILGERFKKMAEARLQAEKDAKKRNNELNAIFSALPDLYFKLNKNYIILDYRTSSPNDLYVTPELFLSHNMLEVLPPEIGDIFHEKLLECADNKKVITWEYPLEIKGKLEFFEARANTISNSSDIILVIRNISRKKEYEESLLLSASVFKNSSECMMVTDQYASIIDVNPAFTKVTGYTKEEILGRKTSTLSSGHQDKAFYNTMWAALTEFGCWEGEIYNRRKNGEVFPEWLNINSIYDEHNQVVQYVALYRDISEQKKATELIWQQAHYDHLTGLPNRKTLIDHLTHEITKAQRHDLLLATLFLDLDQFKHVNDTLGHDKGDQLLKLVATRLSANVRSEDLIGRQGGDEFIIIMGSLPSTSPVIRVAEEIRHSFIEPFEIEGKAIHISVSIGISFYPHNGCNSAELLKTSDQAMYAAKESGRNCFHCFTKSMQDDVVQRMQLINDLHLALESEQFQLYFQPIVCLTTGKAYKAEALIRWNHPVHGLVPPCDFIPLAEETRLITGIGEWVFNEGCRSLKQLQQAFGPDFELSINVSPVQFLESETGLLPWLEKLTEYGINASSLVIEITEGLLMTSSEESLSTLINFRDAGIQVALDDFGTGYSSLAYIQQYDIDYLKIDREFVRQLPESIDSSVLCESIVVMAHRLGIKVIAEGIETKGQEKVLAQMKCDYAQGYLYSKPIPLSEFISRSF